MHFVHFLKRLLITFTYIMLSLEISSFVGNVGRWKSRRVVRLQVGRSTGYLIENGSFSLSLFLSLFSFSLLLFPLLSPLSFCFFRESRVTIRTTISLVFRNQHDMRCQSLVRLVATLQPFFLLFFYLKRDR